MSKTIKMFASLSFVNEDETVESVHCEIVNVSPHPYADNDTKKAFKKILRSLEDQVVILKSKDAA